MPSTLPDGDPAPADGELPAEALSGAASRPLALYVHVPFCTVRCGYCDFNTYTALELGEGPGESRASYAEAAVTEIRLARRVLGTTARPVSTVFFGGGTPTLLPAEALIEVLATVEREFGLVDDAEVTTEANPDSVTRDSLAALREGGFTRLSLGMQSAVPRVLTTLDRTHDPERVGSAVDWARAAGFEEVSLDLIYGTPGETLEDWGTSVEAALACGPDHVSAYSLIVEPGTALARRVRRGELPAPQEDDLADKYLLADERFEAAGLGWYEVSNWARRPESRCRHNLHYWTGADWWGVGPGAHSHVGGVRWWNRKHPSAWARPLGVGESPAQAREVLSVDDRYLERLLLEVRLRDGLDPGVLRAEGRRLLPDLEAEGLVQPSSSRVVLTREGRLLADAVVRRLLG